MVPNFKTSFLSQVFVIGTLCEINISISTSLVDWWSEFLTTNHEVPGSIPGSFSLKGGDAHGDHGLGS